MNYIDIAFLVIAAVMILLGAKRGFLVSMLNVLKYIVAVPAAYYASDSCSEVIYDKYLSQYVQKKVEEKLSSSDTLNELINSLKESAESISSVFPEYTDLSNLNNLTGERLRDYICIDIIRPLSLIVISLVVFLLVLIFVLVIANIIIHIFKQQRKNADEKNGRGMLSITNGLLGALFGLVKSVIFLLVVCMVFEYAASLAGSSTSFYQQVESSRIIEFVNTYNPLI